MEAIENGRHNMLFQIQVPLCKNSLNFFVKEYSQGYVYTGSQAEHNIYIIKPDESFSAFDIGMNCLCATMPDEQLLVIGSNDGVLKIFNVANPEKPFLLDTLTLDPPQNINVMKSLNSKLILCGQLLGNLAVVDCSKKQIVSSIKIPDIIQKVEYDKLQAQSNHVNDITKTDDKTLFVVATNRGLAVVKINDSNHKLLVQS
jgi:WD40 repeat protein